MLSTAVPFGPRTELVKGPRLGHCGHLILTAYVGGQLAMIRIDAQRPAHFCDGLSRRDFLHAGSLAFLGLSLPQLFTLKAQGAIDADKDINCIMLFLVGGPS